MRNNLLANKDAAAVARTLPQSLAARMDELGMSLQELSEQSGLTRSNLHKYLKGQVLPSAPALAVLAIVLNCSADYLLWG